MDKCIKSINVNNRIIWFDGTTSVSATDVVQYISKVPAEKLFVTELSDEICEFNRVCDTPLKIKTSCEIPNLNWNIPSKYKYLNIDEYLITLVDKIEKDELYDKRFERLATEIYLFKKLNLDDILRVLIYVVDTMKSTNVVWGVGRGSSCSSYLLYLLGLHEIDVVKYEIDISDFIKTGD